MTQAIINTKSNFMNLNGTIQCVAEILGTRITCNIYIDGRLRKIDFHIDEVIDFDSELSERKRLYNNVHNTNY
jgi:hypothetical protein